MPEWLFWIIVIGSLATPGLNIIAAGIIGFVINGAAGALVGVLIAIAGSLLIVRLYASHELAKIDRDQRRAAAKRDQSRSRY